MTLVTFQDGKVVLKGGKAGTENGCCCGGCCVKDDGTIAYGVTRAQCEDCTECPDVLVPITLSACRGAGAAAHALTTGAGCPGPITSAVVDSGGSGYAILGRTEPELAITGTGTGATFTPSFTKADAGCGNVTYAVASVSASGGTGYTGGETLTVAADTGSTIVEAATLVLQTAEPTVTASVAGGTGAVLAVTLAASAGHPAGEAPYVVESVAVTDGGTGYTDGASVTFTATGARLATSAVATIHTGTDTVRVNPELTPYVWGFDGTTSGTGAVFSATMTYVADSDAWEVSDLTFSDGGSGYQVGEFFWYTQFTAAYAINNPPYYQAGGDGWWITGVDENGAITQIGCDPTYGFGLYYLATEVDNGVIASVTVTNGGQYDSGVPASVNVAAGGKAYQEDASLTPYVASVTATVGGAGTGAAVTVHVDDSTSSANFGTVASISVGTGGSGYSTAGICGTWKDPCPCTICTAFGDGCCRYVRVTISGSHDGKADGEWYTNLPPANADGLSSAICGPYGPNGEYGWFITKDVCDSLFYTPDDMTTSWGGYWEGFIPLVQYGSWCCAKLGTVDMTCIGVSSPPDGNCHGMTIAVEVIAGPLTRDFVTVPGIPFPVQLCGVDAYCTDYPDQCP